VTGGLTGTGVAIALSKEIDKHPWREGLLIAVIILLAGAAGMLTGAIAAGCHVEDDSKSDGTAGS